MVEMLLIFIKSRSYFSFLILFTAAWNGYAGKSTYQENHFSLHYDASMPHDSVVVIIPGMHQNYSSPGYDSIGSFYTKHGITPVYVRINWKAVGLNTLSATARKIGAMLRDTFPNAHVFLFGFSFGAALSLKLSQSIQADKIILCSMSPIFREDLSHLPYPVRLLLRCITNYSTNGLSYSSITGTCPCFLYGNHDHFVINKGVIQHRTTVFRCNETIIVKGAQHSISDKRYLKAIRENIPGNGK